MLKFHVNTTTKKSAVELKKVSVLTKPQPQLTLVIL